MKFIAVTFAYMAAVVLASPLNLAPEPPLCTGLTSTLQCCATDVLGVADLDCATRTYTQVVHIDRLH